MERLKEDEVKKIIDKLKKNGEYDKYNDMIYDDFEEFRVVYKIPADELIALAHKNNTIPFKMKEYYDWHEMNLLMEEDAGFPF